MSLHALSVCVCASRAKMKFFTLLENLCEKYFFEMMWMRKINKLYLKWYDPRGAEEKYPRNVADQRLDHTRGKFFTLQLKKNRWQTTRKVINGDFPHVLLASCRGGKFNGKFGFQIDKNWNWAKIEKANKKGDLKYTL